MDMGQDDLSDRSDEELVRVALAERGAERGQRAATVLFARHQGRLYALCYRYLPDRARALDAAQDAQLQAWRSLESFAGRGVFAAWLFTIARNRCLNTLRDGRREREDDDALEGLMDPGEGPAAAHARREEEEHLRALVERVLDPVEQEAVWLRYRERLPVDEITRMLEITLASGARGVLQRALRKLRGALDGSEGGLEA